jgi:hypothetical protein
LAVFHSQLELKREVQWWDSSDEFHTKFDVPIWDSGMFGYTGEDLAGRIQFVRVMLEGQVDEFVNEWLKVNPREPGNALPNRKEKQ